MQKTSSLSFAEPAAAARQSGTDSSHSKLGAFDRWLIQRALRSMHNPPVVCELWNGERIYTSQQAPQSTLRINNRRALFKVLRNPEKYFGDCYIGRQVEIPDGDLLDFLLAIYKHAPLNIWSTHARRHVWKGLPKSGHNSLRESRANAQHHYDIGNDFYQLWLDKNMQYSCAYFPQASMTLEQAQVAKMEYICRKLQLRPGQTVVEAGSGWGGLALYMAQQYGVTVKAYNISQQQVSYARQRAMEAGLADKVQYIEDDYRNISGQYDVFVSVGMLEHVGVDNYFALGQIIARCLNNDGRGLIHSIGRNKPKPVNSWIGRRILPGAQPPALSEMMQVFEAGEFSVLDIENLRLHYAKTLQHWLSKFDAAGLQINGMFDESFSRTWRLYLAGSIAAFSIGELQLFQVVFSRKTNNNLPWSRELWYR